MSEPRSISDQDSETFFFVDCNEVSGVWTPEVIMMPGTIVTHEAQQLGVELGEAMMTPTSLEDPPNLTISEAQRLINARQFQVDICQGNSR